MRSFVSALVLLFAYTVPGFTETIQPPADPSVRHYLTIPPGGLAAFMKRPVFPLPMVSHHRGGPMPGFPENSIEAMDNALAYGYGIMEVDVAQLKDGTLILMHDDTLGRTTTGEGALRQKNWADVSDLFLKDENGTVTTFRIPKLEAVLNWAKGRTVLTLDIKRGVDFAKVARMVRETGAQDYAAAISYSIDQAKVFYRLAPDMPQSIGMTSQEDIQAFDASGIPPELAIAWTGTRLKEASFYKALHKRGWRVIVGTLGRRDTAIDVQIRDKKTPLAYRDIVQLGADIIATDRFWAVQAEIVNPNLFIFSRQKLVK